MPMHPHGHSGNGISHGYKPSKGIIKKLWQYFKKYKLAVWTSIILSLLAGIITAANIYLYGMVYDQLAPAFDKQSVKISAAFLTYIMCLLTTYLLSNLFQFIASWLTIRISQRGAYHLRTSLFKKIHKMPIKYFDQTPSGDIMSRVTNDADNVSEFITHYLSNGIFWIFSIISVMVLMFLTNWCLSLIVLSIYPLVGFVNWVIVKRLKPFYSKQQKYLGKLNGFAEEYISGTKIISLFQMQKETQKNFDKINEDLTKNSIVANAIANAMMPINAFFNYLSFFLLSAWGMTFIINGWINPSWGVLGFSENITLLIMFTMFARNLSNPINQLVATFGQLMLCLASGDRIFELLEQKEEQDPINAKKLNKKSINGLVEAKNMNFSYVPGKPILKNINFTAKPSTITALVGPTGAGKTTIANLITKFYDIDSGSLSVDGIDIKNINRDSLRENITMVLQDTFLFGVSVFENIRYGNLKATRKQVIEAAKRAECHEFIKSLPHGYDTILEDNGDNLSQGQRQLIAIARAFLADSKIVILDEATSSIDTKTEIQIQTAMEKLMQNRTTFMIAHRLSTIQNANNILVINHGEIIEHGTHKQLISHNTFYKELYMTQFKGNQI